MTLGQRQELFSQLIAKLIVEMYNRGFQVRCGDFWAKPRVPAEHKANSLHYVKCAADLNLFKDGKFLTTEEDHRQFADYWESLHPNCRNGRRYGDANHYELLPTPREER
jgi:hypothetical protein